MDLQNSHSALATAVQKIDDRLSNIERAQTVRPETSEGRNDTPAGFFDPVPMDDGQEFVLDHDNQVVYPDDSELDGIAQKSTSSKNFATNLMRFVYLEQDRINRTVQGRQESRRCPQPALHGSRLLFWKDSPQMPPGVPMRFGGTVSRRSTPQTDALLRSSRCNQVRMPDLPSLN